MYGSIRVRRCTGMYQLRPPLAPARATPPVRIIVGGARTALAGRRARAAGCPPVGGSPPDSWIGWLTARCSRSCDCRSPKVAGGRGPRVAVRAAAVAPVTTRQRGGLATRTYRLVRFDFLDAAETTGRVNWSARKGSEGRLAALTCKEALGW